MKYHGIFSPYTLIRKRLDAIVAGDGDPAPGTSGLREFDEMIRALADGKPDPFRNALGSRAKRKVEDYPIVKRVAEAMVEMFEVRDAGGFENLKGGVA